MCFLINVYLDDHQSALKYFKDIEVNLNNVLIMTRDLNIRDNDWDILYSHHSTHADTIRDIADSFNLELLTLVNQVSTYYANNFQDMNSVLDLIFLCANIKEFNNHIISPDL